MASPDDLFSRGLSIIDAFTGFDSTSVGVESDRDAQKREAATRRFWLKVFHLLHVAPLVAIVVLAVASLAVFQSTHNAIQDSYIGPGCILYASNENGDILPQLSGASSCAFSVYGEAAISAIAAVFIALALAKACIGFRAVTLLSLCEVAVLLPTLCVALGVSVDTSIGLGLTCEAFAHHYRQLKSCSEQPITLKDGTILYFYKSISAAKTLSWMVVVLLLIVILMFYLVPTCVLCCRHQKKFWKVETGPLLFRQRRPNPCI